MFPFLTNYYIYINRLTIKIKMIVTDEDSLNVDAIL